MRKKKLLLLLLAAVMGLSVFAACGEKTPGGGTDDPPGGETSADRNITDYGVEVLEPFTLPVTPAGEDAVSVTDAEGKEVEIEVDAQNRITFTVIGDYTLTVEAADGTHS